METGEAPVVMQTSPFGGAIWSRGFRPGGVSGVLAHRVHPGIS